MKRRNRKTHRLTVRLLHFLRIRTKWALSFFFIISLSTLVIYLLDFNYSDRTLFILLIILRYSSFIVCIIGFYKLLVNIYHLIRRFHILRILRIFGYLFFIFYGIIIILFESIISVIAGGNG